MIVPQLLELPARHLFNPLPSAQRLSALMAVMLLLPFFALRRHRTMLLWGLWLLAVPLFVATADLLRGADQLQYPRYTITLSPVLCIVAAAFPWPRRWLAHAVPALLAIASLLALPTAYDHTKSQLRAFAALMQASPGEATVIAALHNDAYTCQFMYAGLDYYRRGLPGPVLLLTTSPDDAANNRLASSPGLWLWTLGSSTPQDILGQPFANWRVELRRFDLNTGTLYHLMPP